MHNGNLHFVNRKWWKLFLDILLDICLREPSVPFPFLFKISCDGFLPELDHLKLPSISCSLSEPPLMAFRSLRLVAPGSSGSSLSGDLGIPLLDSGKGFGPSISIRKGWLYEPNGLDHVCSGTCSSPPTNEFWFELKTNDEGVVPCSSLLLIFQTRILRLQSKESSFGSFPCLSHGLMKQKARRFVLLYGKLVGKIQELKLTLPFVDIPILATCWFAL